MTELNGIIHQPARLKIMAALTSLGSGTQLDFSSLGRMLSLTDGNLGAHLLTLEEAGYVKIEKSFINRKPRTHIGATTKGRHAFEEHVEALRHILQGSNGSAGQR